MSADAKKPSFESDDEMWAYIEEQDALLDAFSKVFQKPHEGIPEAPASFAEMERLALAGNPSAQFNLYIAYGKGDGVSHDSEKAAQWLLRAAEGGFPPAQHNIAYDWLDAKDTEKALEWFMKAANQNFGSSQFDVGTICGNSGDYVSAYVWSYLAEQNGVNGARDNRLKAAARLSKEELETARLAASARLMDFQNDD